MRFQYCKPSITVLINEIYILQLFKKQNKNLILAQQKYKNKIWPKFSHTDFLKSKITLKSGVKTTAPALPNSKAVRSWGRTLCLQKSSGKESRLSLKSWKNCCFSAGSLIWTHKNHTLYQNEHLKKTFTIK